MAERDKRAARQRPSRGEASPEQSRRFIEAARELGCDEDGEAYERALDRILPPRKPGQPAAHGDERPAPKGSRRRTKGAG